MDITLTTITDQIRYIIGDTLISGTDVFTYQTSTVFTLTESNAGNTITGVYVNDVEIGVSEYTYDSTTKKVTIVASMGAGDTVQIIYDYYPGYSDTELSSYVRSAIMQLSINRYTDFYVLNNVIYPKPREDEKNLIAMISGILIEPDNKTYRLPDISIAVPNTSMPTDDKIRKTIAVFKKNTSGIFSIV